MQEMDESVADLFKILDNENQKKIRPVLLLKALNDIGILNTDPRVSRIVKNIAGFHDKQTIDLPAFKELLGESDSFLSQALFGELVIPDFQSFCHEIEEIYDATLSDRSGEVTDYLPELASVNPEQYAVAICTADGQQFSLGDADTLFCLQSANQPILYCAALEERGEEKVHQHVGREPSGYEFNKLILNRNNLPHNPLINSGAMVCASLILPHLSPSEKISHLLNIWQRVTGGFVPSFDLRAYLSERDSSDRNFALAYFMKEKSVFEKNVQLNDILNLYFQSCSIQLNVKALAVAAATLANSGICPLTNDKIFSTKTVQNTLSMMYSCGMNDFSGEFAFTVGLPAKSGISGALMVVVPNLLGIAIWSPRVNVYGNAVRGVQFCKKIVERFNFHNYDSLNKAIDKLDPRNKNAQLLKTLAIFEHVSQEMQPLTATQDLEIILNRIVQIIHKIILVECVSAFVNDPERNELYTFIEQEKENQEVRFSNDKGVVGHAFQIGKALIVNDPYNNPYFNPEIDCEMGFVTRNILCVPLIVSNEVIGVIELVNRKQGDFNYQDQKIVDIFISHASLVIRDARSRYNLQKNPL